MFFFKQKTAYEMRISDWSSDVCSSDLAPWLTILVVGHIVVPLMLSVERVSPWPTWLVMTVWTLVTLVLAVVVLPRAKGALLSLIWVLRAPGSESDCTMPAGKRVIGQVALRREIVRTRPEMNTLATNHGTPP